MYKKFRKTIGAFLKSPQQRRHSLVGAGKLWKMKQHFQIQFLRSQGLNKTDLLLDLGCGTLRGGIPIISFLNPKNYYGLEVREHVLEEGKKELIDSKLSFKEPTLISFTDFNDVNINVLFDVIFAFSVLIHLNDDIANSCFKFVSSHLKADGVFFANVNIGSHPDGNWQGFPVVFRSFEFYQALAVKYGLHITQLGTIKSLGHNSGNLASDNQIMLKITKI